MESRQAYWPLIEKLQNRLQGWQGKLLTRAGRLQLVNSVLSSTLIYFMSCFMLPAWVIAKVDKIRRNFMWGKGTDSSKGISWLNWNACCVSKGYGGLGISDIKMQNMALLIRWWWRLYQEDKELWARTVTAIYSKTTGKDRPRIWRVQGSFFWKILWKLQPLFHWSIYWQVGNGRSISFWCDPWEGPSIVSYLDTSRPPLSQMSLREAYPLLQTVAPQMQIEFSEQEDKLIWRWASNGVYSSKSIYRLLKERGKTKWPFPEVWKAKAPPTVRIFGFMALKEKVLTRVELQRRNLNCDVHCVMCSAHSSETLVHLLFTYSYARQVWRFIQASIRKSLLVRIIVPDMSVPEIWDASWLEVKRGGAMQRTEWLNKMPCACWWLWRQRNEFIFRQNWKRPDVLAVKILQEGSLWLHFVE